jgi:hypothetical protein
MNILTNAIINADCLKVLPFLANTDEAGGRPFSA